jgi:hypothetical protein
MGDQMEAEALRDSHKHFSAGCFNETWNYITKDPRSEEDIDHMLHLAHTSFWHWTRREDFTDRERSIGAWLLARVYALAGHADLARRYGHACLASAEKGNTGAFFIGYAHEALARAERAAGNQAAMDEHMRRARANADQVMDLDDRGLLVKDLDQMNA